MRVNNYVDVPTPRGIDLFSRHGYRVVKDSDTPALGANTMDSLGDALDKLEQAEKAASAPSESSE